MGANKYRRVDLYYPHAEDDSSMNQNLQITPFKLLGIVISWNILCCNTRSTGSVVNITKIRAMQTLFVVILMLQFIRRLSSPPTTKIVFDPKILNFDIISVSLST